jgi:hypothetical protein
MNLTIRPYEGIGEINFGMTPQEVHKALRKSPTKTHDFEDYTGLYGESFSDIGLTINYNFAYKVVLVTFNAYTNPLPTLFEREFFTVSMNELKFWLKLIDPDLEEHTFSVISLKYGVQLYLESEDHDEPAYCVMVFSKDYDLDKLERDFIPKGWNDENYEPS